MIHRETFFARRDKVVAALIVLGLTTLFSQMVIIRELLNIFQGNELIIGVILCLWMLLTALGSRLGLRILQSPDVLQLILRLLLLEGILPFIVMVSMVLLDHLIFPPGIAKGLLPVMAFCLGLLTPCCIVSGLLFTLLAACLNKAAGGNRISQAYSWESLGSMLAGALFGLLFSYLLGSFQVLALVLILNAMECFWILQGSGSTFRQYIIPSLLTVAACIIFFSKADYWIRSLNYIHQKVIYTHNTPYGNVTVTSTAGQLNFYGNGNLFFSTDNSLVNEEAVHYAMLQRPEAQHVLIVSGGMSGMTEQVIKYKSVKRIDYLEINPWLVNAEKRLGNPRLAPQVHVITKDARMWIKGSGATYDVILMNTPDPSNAQINRYYTLEFFHEARRALGPKGVFSISLSSTANYVSEEAGIVNSTLYLTLRKVFKNVGIITGERNYFIASDAPVRIDISKCAESSGITNDYVNPYNLDDNLILQNNRNIMRRISTLKTAVNKDLTPRAYFHQIHYWMSIHKSPGWIFPILLLLLLFMYMALKNVNPVSIGVFTTGFAGASAEFLILMIFQIIFGYIYQTIGLIVGFYMLGLVVATIIRVDPVKPKLRQVYLWVQLALLFLVLMIPWVIGVMIRHQEVAGWIIQAFLFVIMTLIAMAAGFTFNVACHLESGSMKAAAGNLYAIDLAGAAGGTMLVSMICFPVFGLQITCLIISLLIATGVLVNLLFYRPERHKIH